MEYKRKTLAILLFEIFLLGVVTGQKNIIDLQNGGYSNLLIAIDGAVPENLTIIDNIKTMFTSASYRLYLASKSHVYWQHIKILVPNTWSLQSYYQFARTETLQSANIVVHNFPDDDPFVDNFAGCGNEGTLMHMTPKYILDEIYREDKFGPTENVLVRNWAYLRWGLYKENYDGFYGAPAYDTSGGGAEGTRCSLKIKGDVLMPNGHPCQSDPNSGYDPSCRFVPHSSGQTSTASLLFGTKDAHIHSIVEFCDNNPSDPHNLHNKEAPNLMNKYCGEASAWEVMRGHTDFQSGMHPVSDTSPIFDVMQLSSVRCVVLVLDISGSMDGNRFDTMIQSSTDYIMNVIPEGSKLGIVVFDTTSEIKAYLTDITDTASRQRLVNALPLDTESATCIGCGILDGIQVLGSYAQGGYLLLLSDGDENRSPYISDTYDDIENSGVIIDTITISNAADPKMEDLSSMTSGISIFCSDTGTGTCLIQAFQSTITERPDVGMQTVPIQIYSSEVVIGSYSSEVVPVIIDSALGNETVITITWTTASSISVVVTGPDGTRVDQYDHRYHVDYNTKIVTVALPHAQPGRWNITIRNTQGITEYASVAVTSKPSTNGYTPVTVGVLLGSRDLDFSQTPALAIYAQVHRDYQPVLNADVTAIISDANSATTTMTLLDNGSGSDLFKDDGTYSGFFLQFTSNGRYNVKVNVLGYDDVIEVAEKRRRKRSAQVEVQTGSEPSFMRTASGGVFKVQSYTPNAADTLPPSRIQDLAYTSFSYDNSTVTLSWTAVGDDMDQGTAFSYELRYSTNFSEVRYNFDNSHRVTQDQLVYGNLSHISAAGVIETVIINLPERGQDIVYYFAIRAWDEAGNGGDLSNIASLSIRFIPLALTSTMDPTSLVTDAVTEVSTIADQTDLITNLDTQAMTEATSEVTNTDRSTRHTVTPYGQSSTPFPSTEDVSTTLPGPVSTPEEMTTQNRLNTPDTSNPRTSEHFSSTAGVQTSSAIDPSTSQNPDVPTTATNPSTEPKTSSSPDLSTQEGYTNAPFTSEPRTSERSSTTHQRNPETTEAKEPRPSERSPTKQIPETTEAKEPAGPEDQTIIIALSCALGVVSIVAVASLMYIYCLKQSMTKVKPTTPPTSTWTQQGLTDEEMVQQHPTYNNPTFSTA